MKILEFLTDIIYHTGAAIVLLFILVALFFAFFIPGQSVPESDFSRVAENVKEVVERDVPLQVSVPLDASQPYIITAYPPGASPPECKGESCLCVDWLDDERHRRSCTVFKGVDLCPDACSGRPCFQNVMNVPAKKSVLVARDECGRISVV